jgi:N-methylhydantoinase B
MPTDVDVVTLSVIRNKLIDICEEMGGVLRRTAYSAAIREAEDMGVALFDRAGRTIAQGTFTPGHMGSMPFALAHALRAHPPETLRAGDGLLLNDPYMGNGHFPDVFCFAPIFHQGELVAYAGSCAHHTDIGGAAPGSQMVVGIYDMFQEGLRIPPVRFYRAGKPLSDIFDLVSGNTRTPRDTAGDLRAQMNACVVGGRRYQQLLDEYSIATVEHCIDEVIQATEQAMRAAIRAFPDGTYRFADYMDDYGPGTEPVRISVTIRVQGDEVWVDFDGTSPQVRSALNSTFNFTYAYTTFALKCVLNPHLPDNAGTRVPFHVSAPPGCFVNPVPPAPCGARATVVIRIVDALMGALAQADPTRVVAAPSHFVNTTIGGLDEATGEPYVHYEMLLAGFGARHGKDGPDGLASCFNTGNIPVEIHEANAPVVVELVEYVQDSAGPGRWRGGSGLRKRLRVLQGPVTISNLTDRFKFEPWGLAGGLPGARGSIQLLRDGQATALHSKGADQLEAGDRIEFVTSGAGGMGPPLERDPALVVQDVLDGFVSREAAQQNYGVVIDPAQRTLDRDATQQERARRQRA